MGLIGFQATVRQVEDRDDQWAIDYHGLRRCFFPGMFAQPY